MSRIEQSEALIAHLYGELDPTAEEALLAQLGEDPELEAELEELKAALVRYRRIPRPATPRDAARRALTAARFSVRDTAETDVSAPAAEETEILLFPGATPSPTPPPRGHPEAGMDPETEWIPQPELEPERPVPSDPGSSTIFRESAALEEESESDVLAHVPPGSPEKPPSDVLARQAPAGLTFRALTREEAAGTAPSSASPEADATRRQPAGRRRWVFHPAVGAAAAVILVFSLLAVVPGLLPDEPAEYISTPEGVGAPEPEAISPAPPSTPQPMMDEPPPSGEVEAPYTSGQGSAAGGAAPDRFVSAQGGQERVRGEERETFRLGTPIEMTDEPVAAPPAPPVPRRMRAAPPALEEERPAPDLRREGGGSAPSRDNVDEDKIPVPIGGGIVPLDPDRVGPGYGFSAMNGGGTQADERLIAPPVTADVNQEIFRQSVPGTLPNLQDALAELSELEGAGGRAPHADRLETAGGAPAENLQASENTVKEEAVPVALAEPPELALAPEESTPLSSMVELAPPSPDRSTDTPLPPQPSGAVAKAPGGAHASLERKEPPAAEDDATLGAAGDGAEPAADDPPEVESIAAGDTEPLAPQTPAAGGPPVLEEVPSPETVDASAGLPADMPPAEDVEAAKATEETVAESRTATAGAPEEGVPEAGNAWKADDEPVLAKRSVPATETIERESRMRLEPKRKTPPDPVEANIAEAHGRFSLGDPEGTLDRLARARELSPGRAAMARILALECRALVQLGRLDEAEDAADRLEPLDGEEATACRALIRAERPPASVRPARIAAPVRSGADSVREVPVESESSEPPLPALPEELGGQESAPEMRRSAPRETLEPDPPPEARSGSPDTPEASFPPTDEEGDRPFFERFFDHLLEPPARDDPFTPSTDPYHRD